MTLRVETLDQDQVQVLQVHSLVLSIHSPVLSHMTQTRKSDTIVLTETPETAAVFHKFIR